VATGNSSAGTETGGVASRTIIQTQF
jgi:hypothetical protein